MARCLTFILEGVKPQANKDQEHDGEWEGGDWKSVCGPQGSWSDGKCISKEEKAINLPIKILKDENFVCVCINQG